MFRVLVALALTIGADASRPVYTPSPTIVTAGHLSVHTAGLPELAERVVGLKTDDGEDSECVAVSSLPLLQPLRLT